MNEFTKGWLSYMISTPTQYVAQSIVEGLQRCQNSLSRLALTSELSKEEKDDFLKVKLSVQVTISTLEDVAKLNEYSKLATLSEVM